MGNSGHEHEPLRVVHRVHDPVIADPNPEVVAAGELRRAVRTRIRRERVDRRTNPFSHPPLEAAVRPRRFGMQANLVQPVAYAPGSRTSAHGTLASRSSRAVSAARLSSR